eukprot:184568-Hanusia_phi.AAC.1
MQELLLRRSAACARRSCVGDLPCGRLALRRAADSEGSARGRVVNDCQPRDLLTASIPSRTEHWQ